MGDHAARPGVRSDSQGRADTFGNQENRGEDGQAIIFCGHFPADVESFTEEETENESRGQWYLRQILGSANISGGKLFGREKDRAACPAVGQPAAYAQYR
jgi:hypothetical protein